NPHLNILTGCVHSLHEAAGAAELKVRCERRADVMSSLLVKFIKLRYCVAAVACSSEERKVPARNAGNKVLVG
ncbi:hypothetical protein L6Y87_24445, partial [Escherichia coli]|uniref:hypothetical protein n=1 Tax=Escherichia coli TaxID=562 RepID=UPI0025405507